MRIASICMIAALLAAVPNLRASKPSHPPDGENNILLTGALNTQCVPNRGGTVYLEIGLDSRGCPLPERVYRPMNLAVVLDRSGSMAEERKMEYARQAVLSLIDRLSPQDFVSIVIYDNVVSTIVPMQHVEDKEALKRLVSEVYPRGTTNLGGGMTEGFRQVEKYLGRELVNRVILLSDGLANQGITDPGELERIAERYRRMSVSLSTIGVGLDYNENLMLGLANHGGGNYYFVAQPGQLPSILDHELSGLSTVVMQDARIEVTLGDGVAVDDVIGTEWNRDGRNVIIPVGDIYANRIREYTMELSVPEGVGLRQLASGVLRTGAHGSSPCCPPQFSVSIRYTNDYAELEKGKVWDVQAKADIAVSTRSVDRAMKSLDGGNKEDADRQLHTAISTLQASPSLLNSPSLAPGIREQIKTLQRFSKDVRDSTDLRKVKKSIQYDNYSGRKR